MPSLDEFSVSRMVQYVCDHIYIIYIIYPIGSMDDIYIYANIYHEYTPNVSIYTSTMDPMAIDDVFHIVSRCPTFLSVITLQPCKVLSPTSITDYHGLSTQVMETFTGITSGPRIPRNLPGYQDGDAALPSLDETKVHAVGLKSG